jgi:magnesium transporter
VRVLTEADLDELCVLKKRHESLWLDLRDPSEQELAEAGEILGLHQLAIEDSREFGQRPKLDRYDGRLLLVFFGLHINEEGEPCPVEVHIHVAEDSVLTVSRVPPAQFERVRQSLQSTAECSQGQLVYRVIDAVADSLTDGLEAAADQVDAFERTIFTRPRARDRDRMALLRRALDQLRRTLVIQRQIFDRAAGAIASIANDTEDIRAYLADVGDHLSRVLDQVDADRETLTAMLETYSNEVQERLTIVATIFLPLTVLTGFFGMNFNWMIDHIGSTWTFFGLGIGGMLASCLLISLWLRRTGLLGGSTRGEPR